MNSILSILNLLRVGASVANPTAWKNHQITATAVGAVIIALANVANAYGVVLPVDMETANAIGAGLIAVVNVILTTVTDKEVGVPQKKVQEEVEVQPEVKPNVESIIIETKKTDDSIKEDTKVNNGINDPYSP